MRKKLTKFVPVQSSYQMLLRNIVLRFVALGTLRFATTDGWTRVARCLGDWIEYGALWRVVCLLYTSDAADE